MLTVKRSQRRWLVLKVQIITKLPSMAPNYPSFNLQASTYQPTARTIKTSLTALWLWKAITVITNIMPNSVADRVHSPVNYSPIRIKFNFKTDNLLQNETRKNCLTKKISTPFSSLIDINLVTAFLPFHSFERTKGERKWCGREILCSLFLRLVIYIDKGFIQCLFLKSNFIWWKFISTFPCLFLSVLKLCI